MKLIFLFLTFFNNILNLIHIDFYLQPVARLVAPLVLARRIATVAPVHVARQGRPRQRPRGVGPAPPASMAGLSRQPQWRNRGYMSRHYGWRDQIGYALQIKTNTG